MKSNQNQQIHLLGTERSKIACHHIEKLNHLSNAHFHNLKPPDTVSHESSKMQPVRCPKTGWCRFTPSPAAPVEQISHKHVSKPISFDVLKRPCPDFPTHSENLLLLCFVPLLNKCVSEIAFEISFRLVHHLVCYVHSSPVHIFSGTFLNHIARRHAPHEPWRMKPHIRIPNVDEPRLAQQVLPCTCKGPPFFTRRAPAVLWKGHLCQLWKMSKGM